MNFITSAAEALADMQVKLVKYLAPRTNSRQGYDRSQQAKIIADIEAFTQMKVDLNDSMKYLVPSPSALNVKATPAALPYVRLPYPICAFEYTIENPVVAGLDGLATQSSTNRIALCYDLAQDTAFIKKMKARGYINADAAGIAVISFYQIDESRDWMPSIGFAVFDINLEPMLEGARTYVHKRSGDKVLPPDMEFYIDNEKTNVSFSTFPLMSYALDELAKGGQSMSFMQATMVNDVAEELAMAVRVSLLLSTKNLKTVKLVEAPVKLNQKRARTGKLPFYTYHTLDIFISANPTRFARKRVHFGDVQAHFSNMQSRLHSVAGHFKHRKTGLFWWNFFVRGAGKLGQVEKEYEVKPQDWKEATWRPEWNEQFISRLNRKHQ